MVMAGLLEDIMFCLCFKEERNLANGAGNAFAPVARMLRNPGCR